MNDIATMSPKKKSIVMLPLAASAVFLAAVLSAVFFFVHLPAVYSHLHRALRDKTKNITDIMITRVSQAVRAHDDVSLLNYLQEMSSSPDFSRASVLSSDGAILADNKIELWAQKFPDDRLVNSLPSMTSPLFFRRSDPSGYDYAVPLEVDPPAFLVTGVSSQKIDADAASARTGALYILAGLIFAGVVFFYLTLHFTIVARLKKIHKNLESVLLGSSAERITVSDRDEIGEVAVAVNSILDKVSKGAAAENSARSTTECLINNFVYEVASGVKSGLVVLDSSDNIVYVNKVACDILGITADEPVIMRGRHVVEVVKDAVLLELLKKSGSSIGSVIDGSLESASARVNITAIDDGSGRLGGTVLVFDRRG
ncbi:MAG: hypothetical protein CVU77_05865 [Elusimicrobia bacterium HGW-Elusimicrobia-1]|jgi:HAMP domain-containing protein|nr:MAG: hypothetical protein CVU77_05865 [Elusimicrobia bacterium HGW-Elusimicrobia-1]